MWSAAPLGAAFAVVKLTPKKHRHSEQSEESAFPSVEAT
jgi:hypothetical protein